MFVRHLGESSFPRVGMAALSSRDSRLVIVAAATGAAVAAVVSELLRRRWWAGLEYDSQQFVLSQVRGRELAVSVQSASSPRQLRKAGSASGRLMRFSADEPDMATMERADSISDDGRQAGVQKHSEDAALRQMNVALMERGRANRSRAVGRMWGPEKTKVVRIALTGGPCAGKSSALEHLIRSATAEGFDVLTAPEIATLYFNSSYQFPSPHSPSSQVR